MAELCQDSVRPDHTVATRPGQPRPYDDQIASDEDFFVYEDRDERGVAEIPDGLSLCRIHHGAYDSNILGITPDYIVEIRHDVLEELDGPMLKHGLQEMNGQSIHVPRAAALKPKPEYLEDRYARFRAA